ncbi:hypothetical protein AVEN_229850-1 [Araneus ventricosus]|uniref:Uncharacterized protein n=1 Tax=Araneus ventricosus TaxID=182803 RepID=A0A4Y2PSW8_ARAVE|nr:hypothetical protein AVEN_229850-1 [Araneus ventricosus]
MLKFNPEGNRVRRFVIPAVDFRATDYVDLIDWQTEGPSQKRPRDTEPASFSSVAARTRAIEERISELRAEDARTPPLRSRRASNEVAGPPPVPAAVFMKLREENEEKERD